jgi:hypothetical protein
LIALKALLLACLLQTVGRNQRTADPASIKWIVNFPKHALQDHATVQKFGGDPGRLLENEISKPEIEAPVQNPF